MKWKGQKFLDCPKKLDTIWGIFMNKKRIFSSEFKFEQVLKYSNNHQCYVCTSKEMGVDHSLITRQLFYYFF